MKYPRMVLPRLNLCLLASAAAIALWTSAIPRAAAADNWIEVRSPHFTVASNASEKDARKIADQFELFRAMCHSSFPTFRLDSGVPIIILAAKNENTMKELLPEDYAQKGHIHHAGMYQAGQDKTYVVLRLNEEGDNPYHTLYHEYTHSVEHLNFTGLPLWLSEGLAEYLGNAQLSNKEARIGLINQSHLYILQQNKLLPIETLLSVDFSSPYYNEENRASVFYAESWALVHYLMLDPDARREQLLAKFLTAWTQSGDQIAAARQTFGDLKKFGQVLEAYARQSTFYTGVVKPPAEALDKKYTSRPLSPAEVLGLRADFMAHHGQVQAASPILAQALQLDPKMPSLHEAKGYYDFRMGDLTAADKEMTEAIQLGSTNFLPLYFHGYFLLHSGMMSAEGSKQAADALSKAIQLNPDFAPAYDALASALERSPDTRAQALDASFKAAKLDPSYLGYAVHLSYELLNNGKQAEAREMASRIATAARTPGEKQIAEQLQQAIQMQAQWATNSQSAQARTSGSTVFPLRSTNTSSPPVRSTNVSPGMAPSEDRPPLLAHRYGVDGRIQDMECSPGPEGMLTLSLPSGLVSFHATDLSKIDMSPGPHASMPETKDCKSWKGRQVRIWFEVTPGRPYVGEILKLIFY